jgi:hypothetical protein
MDFERTCCAKWWCLSSNWKAGHAFAQIAPPQPINARRQTSSVECVLRLSTLFSHLATSIGPVHGLKKSNPSRWILLIDIQKNPDVGPKNVSHKECSPGRIFTRACQHVRGLETVAQCSTVALAVVREIADRRCARSHDAPVRLPTKSASTKRPFHLQHVANLKKPPAVMSSLFSASTAMGWTF